ncbi:MAG: MoaD/ThiS family protein [Bacteroidetes bacterium]|nr:MoaD/ThiS family protein [Bacteroidota bacterium]
MKVTIRFFASMQDAAGVPMLKVDVREGATTSDVLEEVYRQFPQLEKYRTSCRSALNQDYLTEVVPVSDGDELALIPPTSGG